jgi:hypothetical protein
MSDKQEEVVNAYKGLTWEETQIKEKGRNDDYMQLETDPNRNQRPSQKYGAPLVVGFFFGILVLAFVLVVLCVYGNKRCERRKRKKVQGTNTVGVIE